MLIKDIWLSKASKINCFNIKKPLNKNFKAVKKNTLITYKIRDGKKKIPLRDRNNLKFKRIGQNIIFLKKINTKNISSDVDLKFEVSKRKDKQKIIDICLKNMKSSRFDLDSRIPRSIVKKIRLNWISSYFLNIKKKIIYSVKIKNKLIGLLCIKKDEENIVIDLIALKKNFSGIGMGKKMINFLELKFVNYKNILVGTYKENKHATIFYRNNGFKKFKSYEVYHYYEK